MKNLMEGFKAYIGEDQEKQLENKVFKVDAVLRLNKIGGVDINDVLNKIRTIPGVTVISQNENAVNYEQYYVIDTSIKFMTLGKPAIDYIKNVLVPHINSNLKAVGVPSASVRYIKWRSIREI
tara:strand:+ start:5710 stop:6078 length:369 start_codon:yes stop_codon:yes gene_type:complete